MKIEMNKKQYVQMFFAALILFLSSVLLVEANDTNVDNLESIPLFTLRTNDALGESTDIDVSYLNQESMGLFDAIGDDKSSDEGCAPLGSTQQGWTCLDTCYSTCAGLTCYDTCTETCMGLTCGVSTCDSTCCGLTCGTSTCSSTCIPGPDCDAQPDPDDEEGSSIMDFILMCLQAFAPAENPLYTVEEYYCP
jgi:hypothetical protein